jgi:anti-sigma factor RsiW
MNCNEMEHLIHGYLDGELDLGTCLQVKEHLKSCPACARACEEFKALRTAITRSAPYFNAPEGVVKEVRSLVRQTVRKEMPFLQWRLLWQYCRIPVAMTVVALVCLTPFLARHSSEDQLAPEIVGAHVRSLMANHLTDVASSDQHTVKPWFNGKVDFSPAVKDLAPQGFTLVGGRLEYVQNHPAAALVYQRRQHFINLILWPSPKISEAPEKSPSFRGYNLITWTQASMVYCAVSDINPVELRQFVQLVRGLTH